MKATKIMKKKKINFVSFVVKIYSSQAFVMLEKLNG